jgi:MoxR-like ATPase
MAQPVLCHRLILKPEARLRKMTPAQVVDDVVQDVKVPILQRQMDEAEDQFN